MRPGRLDRVCEHLNLVSALRIGSGDYLGEQLNFEQCYGWTWVDEFIEIEDDIAVRLAVLLRRRAALER